MKNKIPEHILKILYILENNNAQPYLVGGCVRDTVMGICPHDYDITVLAKPQEVISYFAQEGYKTIDIGKKFGTIGVLAEGEVVEITPYRTESDYNDSRHPEKVEFVSDIKLDLSRRDFTINAMAMNKEGAILDVFGGCEDIKNGIVRCVGVPKERFTEDALRILRAIRFASRFGFSIEEKTMSAMLECKSLLKNISGERIKSELEGTLASPKSFAVLSYSIDIISEIIPGFLPDEFLSKNTGDFALRLFSCIYKESYQRVLEICNILKLSNAEKEKILALHMLYHKEIPLEQNGKIIFDKKIKRILCDYPAEFIKDIFVFTDTNTEQLDEFIDSGVYTVTSLEISGGEIANLGIFERNMTAKVLKEVLLSVATGETENTKDGIIAFLNNLEI